MAIYVKYEKKQFTPAPEGLWQAVCCDVVDRGIQKTPWGDQVKIEIRWQLEQKDENDKPFQCAKWYTPSLHEKANLRKDLEKWRGRRFSEDELKQFDVEKLIGANCKILIAHNIKEEGEVYANVSAIMAYKAADGPRIRVSDDYVRHVEREKRKELEAHPDSKPNGREASDESYVPF